jgi:hypothetical protein
MTMALKYKFSGPLLNYLRLNKNNTYSLDWLYSVIINTCKKYIMPIDLASLLFPDTETYKIHKHCTLPGRNIVINALRKHIIDKTTQGIVILNDNTIGSVREMLVVL